MAKDYLRNILGLVDNAKELARRKAEEAKNSLKQFKTNAVNAIDRDKDMAGFQLVKSGKKRFDVGNQVKAFQEYSIPEFKKYNNNFFGKTAANVANATMNVAVKPTMAVAGEAKRAVTDWEGFKKDFVPTAKRLITAPVNYAKSIGEMAAQPKVQKMFNESTASINEQARMYSDRGIQLMKEGKTEEAKRWLQQAQKLNQMIPEMANKRIGEVQEAKQGLVENTIDTAKLASMAYNPAGVASTTAVSGALNTAIDKAMGEDTQGSFWEGAGKGLDMSGVLNITNPVIAGVVGKYAATIDSPVKRQLIARTLNGFGNVIEDEIINRANLRPEDRDIALSFGTAFILSGKGDEKDYQNLITKLTGRGVDEAVAKQVADQAQNAKAKLDAGGRERTADWSKWGKSEEVSDLSPVQMVRKREKLVKQAAMLRADGKDDSQVQQQLQALKKQYETKFGLPKNGQQFLSGGLAGVEMEQDEEGNYTGQVRYDPVKGAIGMGAMAGFTSTKKHLADFDDIVKRSDSAENAGKVVVDTANIKISDILDKVKAGDKTAINDLKGIRAALNQEMYKIAGVDPKEGKFQKVILETAKGDPDVAPFIDQIEDQVIRIDDILKGNNRSAGQTMEDFFGQGTKPKAPKTAEEIIGKVTNNYRYHTTSPANIESIKTKGLLPNEGQYGKGVYLAPSEELTKGYGAPEGAMLRVKKESLGKYGYDEFKGEQGWTDNSKINPEDIEVKNGENWEPLVKTTKQADFFQEPEAISSKASEIIEQAKQKSGWYRFADETNKRTPGRGGTWFTDEQGEGVVKDAMNKNNVSEVSIGGNNKYEFKGELKNPLVIEDSLLEDGSFSVINNGYEDYIPKKYAQIASNLYEVIHEDLDSIDSDEVDKVIMDSLYEAGVKEKTARDILEKFGKNKFDAAMDLIIGKGLKESGYDGLILDGGTQGRHMFNINKLKDDQFEQMAQPEIKPELPKPQTEMDKFFAKPTTETEIPQLSKQMEIPEQKPEVKLLNEKNPKLQSELPEAQTIDTELKENQPFEEIIAQGREQIGRSQEPEVKSSIKKEFDTLYTQWVDRYNPIVRASKFAKKVLKGEGAELRPEFDPEYLVRRLTGAGGIADARFRTELNPVIKQMEDLGIEKIDMDTYLANKRIAGFGKAGRDIYGADPEKAKQIISALEKKYGEGISEIAEQFYDYQNKGFNEMIKAGFISPEDAKIIKQQNPDYSPLYRVMDAVDDYLGLPTRKTMVGTQPIKKIKGSDKLIESPVESIIGNTFSQQAAIEKNRVARAIVDLQKIAPDLNFSKVKKSGNDTITIWKDGKKEYWSVGEEIASVAKGLNEESMNMVLKIIQAPASLLRQGATGRNPEFMLPNVVRDQLDAGITSKYGYIPFVDYLSGLKSMITKDEVFQSWEKSGAKIDLGEMSGKKSIAEHFDKNTQKKKLFGWISEGLDIMGKYSEQPTRVGLYKKALKKTGNEMMAMMESRDATVDFARMGSKMKVANSVIPFINVGVQGFDKLIRSVKDHPGKVALNAAIYGAVPAITTTAYNLANFPEEYAEVPQFDKDDNFIIIKGRAENGNVDYLTIPKGNILPIISNPIESFMAYMAGQDKQSFGELVTSLVSGTLPIIEQGKTLKEVGVKTIGSNIPQIIKPTTENLMNKSFYKYSDDKQESKEIVPFYLQNKPAYLQHHEYTPEMYKTIGAVLNISPLKVQNMMEGYLAGFSKIPAQLVDLMDKVANKEEINPNDKTLLRRFVKQTYPSAGSSKDKPKEKSPGLLERIMPKARASEESEVSLPADMTALEVIYKDAQNKIKNYETDKAKAEYLKDYDSDFYKKQDLKELEEKRVEAQETLKLMEQKYPEKMLDIEIGAYKSGGGSNVEERAKWVNDKLKKYSESGDTKKVMELIDKLWDEKVLTGGSSGVAAKLLEEYGIDVYGFGSDPSKSKNPNAKKASGAKDKLNKNISKIMSDFFGSAADLPSLGGGQAKAPKSQVNWGNMAFSAPVSEQEVKLETPTVKAPQITMEQFFAPKKTSLSTGEATQAVNAVRSPRGGDSRLKLRYSR